MSLGKLAVLAIALSLVSGGVGAALADWNSPEPGPAIEIVNVDARIEDDVDGTLVAEEDDDAQAGGGGDNALPPLGAPGAQKDDEPARAERPQAALAPVQPVPAGPSASDDVDTGGGAGGGGADDDDDAAGGGGGGEDDDGGDD